MFASWFSFYYFSFPKEEHRTICDSTLVLQDLICSDRKGYKGALKLLTLASFFFSFFNGGKHRNSLYVILLSVLAAVLLYEPFKVTNSL